MKIPILGERWLFDTRNTLKKVKIHISERFWNLSFSQGCLAEHFKQERDDFVTINDILKYTNELMKIPILGERRLFETLNTLKKVKILISGRFWNFSFSHGCLVEHFKQERDDFVTINDTSKYTDWLMHITILGERWLFDRWNTLKKVQILISRRFWNLSFGHGCLVEHFEKEKETTLLQLMICQSILISLWRFQF